MEERGENREWSGQRNRLKDDCDHLISCVHINTRQRQEAIQCCYVTLTNIYIDRIAEITKYKPAPNIEIRLSIRRDGC